MATKTTILDPTTHVAKQRTTFMLKGFDCLGNLRLGGLGAYIGTDGALNSASGMAACIDSITLRLNGSTVQEIRNASVWAAFVSAAGTADSGDSVMEPTTLSNQRFVPYTRDRDGNNAPIPMQTIVCSYQNVAGVNLAGVQESYLDLQPLVPFLQSVSVLQCSIYSVELEILYKSDLQNLLPFQALPNAVNLTAPYLMVEQFVTVASDVATDPQPFDYIQVLTDSVQVPATTDGTVQSISLQSRGFVGRAVQDIIFCKTTGVYQLADEFTGVYDASYAQSLESLRLWVDGQQMTSIIANPALLQSYAPEHRACLVHTRPVMQSFALQADLNTQYTLSARSYLCVPVGRAIEQNVQIDYQRTGFDTDYPYGIAPINMVMFARVVSSFKYDKKTGAVVVN